MYLLFIYTKDLLNVLWPTEVYNRGKTTPAFTLKVTGLLYVDYEQLCPL